MISVNEVKQISSIFYEILNENEYLQQFKNLISCGRIIRNQYVGMYKILIKKNNNQKLNDLDINFLENDLITIYPFTIKSFNSLLSNSYNKLFRTNKEFHYLITNNTEEFYNSFTDKKVFQTCINLNKDIKISKRGHITFLEMMSYFEHDHTNQDFEKNILKAFFIGESNSLLAFLTRRGHLCIREQVIVSLIKRNDKNEVKIIIKNLLDSYYQFFKQFYHINIMEYSDNIFNNYKMRIYDYLVDINNIDSMVHKGAANISSIENYITSLKHEIKNIVTNSIFGVNDSYSYHELLTNIMEKTEKVISKRSHESFQAGVSFGLKLEMIGWKLSNTKFSDDSLGNIWWEKDIEIIPDKFIYQDQLYQMPEENRIWKITKLYVSTCGKMKCEGKHPNVLRNTVCMGDLKINWSSDEKELLDIFEKIEKILDIINFDSSYDSSQRDILKKISTKLDSMNKNFNKTDSKNIEVIKEINFDDMDDEDDEIEEEILDVNEECQIKVKINKKILQEIDQYEENLEIEDVLDSRENNSTEINSLNENYICEDGSIISSFNRNNEVLELTLEDIL